MPKVKVSVFLPSTGDKAEVEFDVHEDDCDDEAIGEMVRAWVDETISFEWEVEEDY